MHRSIARCTSIGRILVNWHWETFTLTPCEQIMRPLDTMDLYREGGGPFATPSKELIGLHFLYHLEAAWSLYVTLSFICPFRFLFLLSQQSLCQYCQKRVSLQKKESFIKNIWILHMYYYVLFHPRQFDKFSSFLAQVMHSLISASPVLN